MNMTDEQVDLSDLDLLDDENRHARCTFCTRAPLGVPFIALCGVRAIHWTVGHPTIVPPNACDECERVWEQPCRRCGH